MIKDKIIVFVPHKIVSEANNRDHWTKKNKRKIALFWAIKSALCQYNGEFPLPCIITLERVGKRNLDDDNLAYAFKSVRDFLAKIIIERTEKALVKPIGCYDSDPRLTWKYEQRTQANTFIKNQPLGFWITIEALEKIMLSDKDRDAFLETLKNPPTPNEKLREAIKCYQSNRTEMSYNSDDFPYKAINPDEQKEDTCNTEK
jgi:hypothetical protein